jgi:hypothetical protein
MTRGERFTSSEGYRKAVLSGRKPAVNQQIYDYLAQYDREQGFTRNEISVYTGIRVPSVCSSVHALIKSGKVYEIGSREDKFTKQDANALRIIDPDTPLIRQETLFE